MRKIVLSILILSWIGLPLVSQTLQQDSLNFFKKRKKIVAYSAGGIYITSVSWLYTAWYMNYKQSPFHLKNDMGEWMNMDKFSHAHNAYQNGNYGYWALRWAGANRKTAIWFGGSWGLIYATTIEIFDGLSAEWGFSIGDMMANTAGASLFIGQQLLWGEQRVRSKFSYHTTHFPYYRPDLLGSNWAQRLLKDYNGHTYWLSANIYSFLPKQSKFPPWINLAVGYGATGMIGGYSNPSEIDGNPLPFFDRTAQFYLSADIDWTRIKTKSHFLHFLFKLFSFVKLPFPTLEYNNKQGLVFHPVYF